MRCEIGGVERGVVQRDRLNQALERNQRGAGAAILRSRSLGTFIVAGADEERQRLGRIDWDVSRLSGKGRRRRRGGIAIGIASRVYPEAERSGGSVGACEGHRYIR